MNIAIILSGGVGSRMGLNLPKQYVLVNDQPVINYCLKTFLDNEMTNAIVIGVADEWKDFVMEYVAKLNPLKPIYYAQPGETRQYSIYNALKVVRKSGFADEDIVLIHDAARPLVSNDLINRCYNGCKEADGIMPVNPVKDTTYLSEDGKHIQSLLNRSHLWGGQAPEAFRFGKYINVHDEMPREELLKINGSTEIAFKAGLDCKMVEGDPMNFKITTPEDLSSFEAIIKKA
ncbi:IspD/TarI family cytidylyltransferase [Bacteroides bouchesdurhonensis]|uniref:IspD/TarI family cytidylyltransferase n=1 Tax=Bacteroides bouchesdurhonensis TaxID=1841855 RepID=UPI00097F7657|nr:IspD/TarI family cytidylyltransferase [Bacteroides bouchesdurhonensis]